MLTLIGTALGGLFRFAPELLKWFDRKDERKHEINLLAAQINADRARAEIASKQAEMQINVKELEALIEGTRAQSTLTGVKWVDAISALMRPLITFWWVIVMYSVALVAEYIALTSTGTTNINAILTLWGEDEKAIAASIISFWFVDRSLRKVK